MINSLKFKSAIFLLIIFFITGLGLLLITFRPIFAQTQDCELDPRHEGLISATEGISGGSDTFGNTGQVCVINTQDASYRDFNEATLPSYADLENQFYHLTRSAAKKTGNFSNGELPGFTGNGIYRHNGDLNISCKDSTCTGGSGAQVIFINGTLTITDNINYAATDSSSGLVFIVKDNINILSSVTNINAVLISSGIICTAYSGPGCLDGTQTTGQLTINGSLISLNKTPLASPAILLRRNLANNLNQPAEKINKQPKYLYILRGGLLTKELTIIQEDKSYTIPPYVPTGNEPPPPPPPPSPPPPQSGCGVNPKSISDIFAIVGICII